MQWTSCIFDLSANSFQKVILVHITLCGWMYVVHFDILCMELGKCVFVRMHMYACVCACMCIHECIMFCACMLVYTKLSWFFFSLKVSGSHSFFWTIINAGLQVINLP